MTVTRSSLLIGMAALLLLTAPSSYAAGVAPKRASDLVTLRAAGPISPLGCPVNTYRVDEKQSSSGTSTSAFTIPSGKVLVVTGVSWNSTVTSGASEGNSLTVGGTLQFLSGSVAGNNSSATTSAVISNIVVKSGIALCAGISNTIVQGFLATDN